MIKIKNKYVKKNVTVDWCSVRCWIITMEQPVTFYRIKRKYLSTRTLLLLGQMPETRPSVDRCGRRESFELLPLTLMFEEKLPSPSSWLTFVVTNFFIWQQQVMLLIEQLYTPSFLVSDQWKVTKNNNVKNLKKNVLVR